MAHPVDGACNIQVGAVSGDFLQLSTRVSMILYSFHRAHCSEEIQSSPTVDVAFFD